MHFSCRLHRLGVLLTCVTLGSFLHAAPAETSYTVTGVIRDKLSDHSLLIAHDEIPGYMAAMTMAFDLDDPRDGGQLAIDSRVRFRLRPIDDRLVVDRFVVLGKSAPPPVNRNKVARLRNGDALPAISLLDERDRPLTQDHLRGRFTLATFIFTRCPVPEFCPAMARTYASLQAAIEQDAQFSNRTPLRLLSITLDPTFDRPNILAAYGEAVGAKPAIWTFATGTEGDITTLTRRFAVFTERNGVALDHTLCTALIGPDGTIREIWRGNGWTVQDVLAFVRAQPDFNR